MTDAIDEEWKKYLAGSVFKSKYTITAYKTFSDLGNEF